MNIFIFKPHIHDASCARAHSWKKEPTNPVPIINTTSNSSGNGNQSNMILIFNEPSVNIEYELEHTPPPSPAYSFIRSFVYSSNEFFSANLEIIFVLTYQQMDNFFLDLHQFLCSFRILGKRLALSSLPLLCFDYTLNVRTSCVLLYA